ncbi:DUF2252 domain-containing protein [Knoellia sp. 3-2P3]|uniref:DUF2252 domain-containing protein n=1 Tax=unclassified Knoellia TaxID=2618719 RepID=UPI0023DB6525|nr:DUF2252 domain-containing protein [Knoellia sp. 3-2P3]MDF2093477.1 DUF2252 domain-containing protein [Knoellia sp. 3-2P3]
MREQHVFETPEARAAKGLAARKRLPPEAHAALDLRADRDPVSVLAQQLPSRLPDLVGLRNERMSASPFAFYRGGAAVMAADLAPSAHTGLFAQLCGDAHLANFGMFASPERNLLFDINDFDETSPGPWEWDVKRLVASLVVAGRSNGFTEKQNRKVVVAAARRYQDAMNGFAVQGNLAVWYARVSVTELRSLLADDIDAKASKRFDKVIAKAMGRDHLRSVATLTQVVDGVRRINSDPPLLVPVAELAPGVTRDELEESMENLLWDYADSLAPGHRELARSYSFVDMARKVVGVGSVGTRCWVVLMRGRDDGDPLLLQVKEAQPSVVAAHLGLPKQRHEGVRVVAGQRVMQAASDMFLGWQRAMGLDQKIRDFYIRQLHDWKGSATIEDMVPKGLRLYAEVCAWTLARAHARSGDRIAIAAYLGEDEQFAQAMASFADSYAEVNARDHARFVEAVRSGAPMLTA